ncbi:metallophosphoesterase [Leptospira sp. WS39.C2]
MNFYWNQDSISNLIIDFLFLGLIVAVYHYFKNRYKNKGLVKSDYKIFLKVSTLTTLIVFLISNLPFVSSFLFVRFCWQYLTVFFPLFVLFRFVRMKIVFSVIFILILIPFKFYAEVVEPSDLEIQYIKIETNKIKSKLYFVHISDLHYEGNKQELESLFNHIGSFKPNLIFITGDFLNDDSKMDELFQVLSLKNHFKIVMVDGDHDSNLDFNQIEKLYEFYYLENKSYRTERNHVPFNLVGIKNKSYKDQKNLDNLVSDLNQNEFNILLSHKPDVMFLDGMPKFDLVLAGHTHGGQFNLPWIGPISTVSRIPNWIAKGGKSEWKGTTIISNRGFGMEGHVAPRIRFLCRPHVVLLGVFPLNKSSDNSSGNGENRVPD